MQQMRTKELRFIEIKCPANNQAGLEEILPEVQGTHGSQRKQIAYFAKG